MDADHARLQGQRRTRRWTNPTLQSALAKIKTGWVAEPRARPPTRLPEFEALRDQGRDIKNHALAHLDLYLEAFERKVIGAGGHVHWARDAAEARADRARALPRGRRQHGHQAQVAW